MEVAVQCRKRRIHLCLEWLPREQNVRADELSNGVTHSFTPRHEVKADLQSLQFEVLEEMLHHADAVYETIAERKQRGQAKRDATNAEANEAQMDADTTRKRPIAAHRPTKSKLKKAEGHVPMVSSRCRTPPRMTVAGAAKDMWKGVAWTTGDQDG